MQHVYCKSCGVGISKVQRDSHDGMCGQCWVKAGFLRKIL